jgi:hypothetical protein
LKSSACKTSVSAGFRPASASIVESAFSNPDAADSHEEGDGPEAGRLAHQTSVRGR